MRVGRAGAVLLLVPLLMSAGCANRSVPRTAAGPRTPMSPQTVTSSVQPGAAASGSRVRTDNDGRGCTAGDLVARFRPESQGGVDGAGGHLVLVLDFRNVSSSPCRLSGYPQRVTVSEPGRPPVAAADGSFFPTAASRPMGPGGVTALGLETDSVCPARPAGGPAGPRYHHVRVHLPGGVLDVVAPHGRGGLDVGCGVHLTRFTEWR